MADLIALTTQPIRLQAAAKQERYLAVEVGQYDVLQLQLFVPLIEGTNPAATFKLITSMQDQTDSEGWADVWTFPQVTANNSERFVTLDGGFLHYLRWELVRLDGSASPAVTFWIRGIGRMA